MNLYNKCKAKIFESYDEVKEHQKTYNCYSCNNATNKQRISTAIGSIRYISILYYALTQCFLHRLVDSVLIKNHEQGKSFFFSCVVHVAVILVVVLVSGTARDPDYLELLLGRFKESTISCLEKDQVYIKN